MNKYNAAKDHAYIDIEMNIAEHLLRLTSNVAELRATVPTLATKADFAEMKQLIADITYEKWTPKQIATVITAVASAIGGVSGLIYFFIQKISQ